MGCILRIFATKCILEDMLIETIDGKGCAGCRFDKVDARPSTCTH